MPPNAMPMHHLHISHPAASRLFLHHPTTSPHASSQQPTSHKATQASLKSPFPHPTGTTGSTAPTSTWCWCTLRYLRTQATWRAHAPPHGLPSTWWSRWALIWMTRSSRGQVGWGVGGVGWKPAAASFLPVTVQGWDGCWWRTCLAARLVCTICQAAVCSTCPLLR